jgi:hypothetical protein
VRHRPDHALQLERHVVGLLRGAAGGEAHERAHPAVVHLREELAAEPAHEPGGDDERRGRAHDDEAGAAHRCRRHAPVAAARPLHAPVERHERPQPREPAREAHLGELRGEHRHERERRAERGDDGERDRQDQLAEDERREPAHEQEGQHGGEVGGRRRDHRARDLAGADVRGLDRVVDPLLVLLAEDVLEHHDRVVHQHADAEREPPSDMMLSVSPASPMRTSVASTAIGIASPMTSVLRIDCRKTSTTSIASAAPSSAASRTEFTELRMKPAWFWMTSVLNVVGDEVVARELPEPRVDVVGGGDRVAVGLLADGQLDRRHAVEPRPEALLLVRVLDAGHVAERDEPAAARREAHGADVVDRAEAPGRDADDLLLRAGDAAGGHVLVLRPQRGDHLRDGEPVGAQPLLVERHAHLAHEPPGDVDRRDALHGEELRPQPVLHPRAQRHEVARGRRERHLVDRQPRGVRLPDGRRLGLLGELRAGAVERGGRVLEREVDVGAVGEVQLDPDAPFLDLRLDAREVLGGGERRLERFGHRLLEHARLDARVVHADADLRVDDARQQVERQAGDEQPAEHEDHRGEHHRPDGTADRPAGDPAPLRRDDVPDVARRGRVGHPGVVGSEVVDGHLTGLAAWGWRRGQAWRRAPRAGWPRCRRARFPRPRRRRCAPRRCRGRGCCPP